MTKRRLARIFSSFHIDVLSFLLLTMTQSKTMQLPCTSKCQFRELFSIIYPLILIIIRLIIKRSLSFHLGLESSTWAHLQMCFLIYSGLGLESYPSLVEWVLCWNQIYSQANLSLSKHLYGSKCQVQDFLYGFLFILSKPFLLSNYLIYAL